MRTLNSLFQELGISKVKLAKYLGVSRQMVYNYLESSDVKKLPKDKKILIYKLLDINDKTNLDDLELNTDYLVAVENRLAQGMKNNSDEVDTYLDMTGLDHDYQVLLSDMTNIIKEKLQDDSEKNKKAKINYHTFLYLYHMIQSLDNAPELRYLFGYMSKSMGFTDPDEYAFDEEKQFILETILYTALTLYYSGGSSKSKLKVNHDKWLNELAEKKEEQLSRTQQLNSAKVQALSELGYSEINKDNASEVLAKIAEITTRKV